MSEYEEIAEVDEPVVVEHVTVVEEPSPAGEMLRFFVLVIILGVVILVVAVVRPLIFNRIVPSVMGEGIVVATPEPPVAEEPEEINTPEESLNEGQANEEVTAPDVNTTDEPESPASNGEEVTGEGEAEVQEGIDNDGNGRETTANENNIHTVQPGETLQKIAAQYNVTLQELLSVNYIPNPNYIRAGERLVIPQPEGEE